MRRDARSGLQTRIATTKAFRCSADRKLTAFLEVESATRAISLIKISGRVRKRASPLLIRQFRQKRKRTLQTFATVACDRCNRKGERDRYARSLLDAMPMWGRLPDLLLCDQVLLFRHDCGIAFQAQPPAFRLPRATQLRPFPARSAGTRARGGRVSWQSS